MILKLAWRNIIGGGFRTWLNVFILSVVIVTIIGFHGMYTGWQKDGENGIIKWHVAGGQYWQSDYDPYDSFSYDESRQLMPASVPDEEAVEFLVGQGVIYPQGRMKNITLKGVEEEQDLLELPTEMLTYEPGRYKLMLGHRTARKLKLDEGDRLMLRWRDAGGSFDAASFEVVKIFKTTVSSIDQGQVWLGIQQLRKMMGCEEAVNYFSIEKPITGLGNEWKFKSQDYLLSEFRALISAKIAGGMFMYALMLFLAMIAVFDTQVLALFKRRKEVGMMMAIGMNRDQIIRIFTLEGFISGLLSVGLAAVWGTPLLIKFQENGLRLPDYMDAYGVDGIIDSMYPQYTIGLVIFTVIIVLMIMLAVSYLPVRSISRLLPVDALLGRMTVPEKKKKQYS
ncbi:MAG: FtsX-like permease family protein [Candidatus Stygibacter australis]|nr:FtsX-like permease family protein [Candidatus Stygibacter australis]MDP8321168.1 FtsX-like permease family protein [Candidatus Stygibacter australis]